MKDFEYAGKRLSDFGMILCRFDSSGGFDIVSEGSEVTFNTVSTLNGKRKELVSVVYEDTLETTLQICRHSCARGIQEITPTEHRELIRWLCRNRFLKLKFFDEHHIDLYYEAAINVNKIKLDGKLIGLELKILCNTPFAIKEPKVIKIENKVYNGEYFINDTSHEEGYIYPYTEIVINADGDLNIYNAIENRDTHIKNCVQGETITMNYPIIQSSIPSHNIQNDFNWSFFRIANTYENSRNDLIISLPCSMKVEYSPIVKIGL